MGASPLSKGSGAVGDIVTIKTKQTRKEKKENFPSNPEYWVIVDVDDDEVALVRYSSVFQSLKDATATSPVTWSTRKLHQVEFTGFDFEAHQKRLKEAALNFKLTPTTSSYTSDSPVLDRLIREAIAVLETQSDWIADYAGYRSKPKYWEVAVGNKDGRDIGSLFFERMIEASDFDTVDPNENYEWLNEHEGYWWRADENLEMELYERDLEAALVRLAEPLAEPVQNFKSCPVDAIGPEAKALITAIDNLPPLETKNSAPQKYQAYWDVQDGDFQGLRIEICPPNVLLGHLVPGDCNSERDINLTLDNASYYLGGRWHELLADPGRYQDLADLLNRAIAGSKVSNENSDPFGKGPSIGFGFSIQTCSENEPELLQAKIDLGLWPHNEAATSTA